MQRILISSAVLVLCACSTAKSAQISNSQTQKAVVAQQNVEAPALRLGSDIAPVHYDATLKFDPKLDTFDGDIRIAVNVKNPTSLIWLNGNELKISKAELIQNNTTVALTVIDKNKNFLGLQLPSPVAAGNAVLHLQYSGAVSAKEVAGAVRQQSGDDWYVFSHFEPLDARRVFPCFDEPNFKVPWKIALKIPQELIGLTNTPEVSSTPVENNFKVVQFAQTKPLPSYLLAFAVGPFSFADGGKVGAKQTPLRIVTPRNRAAEAEYAVKVTPEIVGLLEEYFKTPYPYEKIDLISVPHFGGAMENPGLITFSESLILAKSVDNTLDHQRWFARICAHELAHQWFGDLVTMQWWDDLWLNEAFATWMTPKIISKLKPEWKDDLDRTSSAHQAMSNDSLTTARMIRQPIASNNDIHSAFDGITYGKGAAVLHMFEMYVGEDKFQQGVKNYLDKFAHKNATAEDFMAAISAQFGKDIAPMYNTFLEQVGVPQIQFDVTCQKGQNAQLKIAQKRYLPLGAKDTSAHLWKMPICFRYGVDNKTTRQCTILQGKETTVELASTTCPNVLISNDAAAGYYRSVLSANVLKTASKNLEKNMQMTERMRFASDTRAAAGSGDLTADEILKRIPGWVASGERQLITAAASFTASVDSDWVEDSVRVPYSSFVRKNFEKLGKQLGLLPKNNESTDATIMRPQILALLVEEGQYKGWNTESLKLARAWLKDHNAIPTNSVDTVLRIAALTENREFFEELHQAAKAAKTTPERQRLIQAMSAFKDSALVARRLGIVLQNEFDARESISFVWSTLQNRETRETGYEFVKTNYDTLKAALPREYEAWLPFAASSMCTQKAKADAATFFTPRTANAQGGPRKLAQALESIDLCAAATQFHKPTVTRFFTAKAK